MKNQIILIVGICLVLVGSLSADTKFTEAVSNLWSDADNWSNGLPGPDDKVQFNVNTLCILDYDAGVIDRTAMEGSGGPTHLRLVDGAQVTTTGWSIIGYGEGTPEEPHLLEVLGGVYNAQIRMKIGFNGSGKLVVDHGGTVNMLDEEFDIAENANSRGVVELKGGSLNILSDAIDRLRMNRSGNGTARMDFSGGLLNVANYSDAILATINNNIADGMITAYGGIGNVSVDTGDANDFIHVRGVHPRNPVPADGMTITTSGNITLSWTVDAGTEVDVWFDTHPELLTAEKIVDKKAMTSVSVKTDLKQRYYWAVDTYAAGAEEPNLGPIFEFNVDNLDPVVKAGDDVTTWLDNGSVEVTLAGTVADEDPTTTLWTVVSEPDDPNSPDAVIADPAALNTAVTLSALGTYVLRLAADDGEYQGQNTLTINVFDNSCEAAQSLPGYIAASGDINGDCVVDQADIDLLLEQWLKCNGLDCPDVDPTDPVLP